MKYNDKHLLYWIWFAEICGPASRRGVSLIREFQDPELIYKATSKELIESGIIGIKDRIYADIMKHDVSSAREILSWCNNNSVSVITPESIEYPPGFRSLTDAPLVLYAVGDMPDFSNRCSISIVGTRSMTEYGKEQAFKFGYALAHSGAIVVSGLALGIDGLAMASAIEAGGKVVGIIGNGIDQVYPRDHAKLYRNCALSGAVISEYAPGTSPSRKNFPQRNRLISAASNGTLVIEGDVLSGAMITAQHAIYQGKDLFALPGSVENISSSGPNELIKRGAFAVTSPKSLIERYEYLYPKSLIASLAFFSLDGVDIKSSAERTSLKYSTHGTLLQENDNYYNVREADSVLFRESSVLFTQDVIEGKYIPLEVPKVKALKKNARKFAGKQLKEKKLFEETEPVRIDLDMLSDTDKSVYMAMIPDTPMLPDEISVKGLAVKDILASLTLLEISGAVEAGAAGYFMRTGSDDIFEL